MSTKQQTLERVLDEKVVAIIRLDATEQVTPTIEAIHAGGLSVIEVTMGTPRAIQHIEQYARHDSILIGVGSVTDAEAARVAISAGAKFIVTPITKASIIEVAALHQVPVFSGAFSPGEILQAYEWGADVIKVFPADTVGMSYFKAIKAPMPFLPLMPTGGVTLENACAWLKAGACALGIGSALTNRQAIAKGNYEEITQNAQQLRASITANG